MENIKPIETSYNGYRFRSRLEARWAVFFDSLGIPYIYEPEGLNINGVTYLPDFYLPDCRQFFEVKGVLDSDSERKVTTLIDAGFSVTIGYENGLFQACDHWGEVERQGEWLDIFKLSTDSALCRCLRCGKYWFMGYSGYWGCQCCETYDGDHHFTPIITSEKRLDGSWYLTGKEKWDVARQARFEHGETPQP